MKGYESSPSPLPLRPRHQGCHDGGAVNNTGGVLLLFSFGAFFLHGEDMKAQSSDTGAFFLLEEGMKVRMHFINSIPSCKYNKGFFSSY